MTFSVFCKSGNFHKLFTTATISFQSRPTKTAKPENFHRWTFHKQHFTSNQYVFESCVIYLRLMCAYKPYTICLLDKATGPIIKIIWAIWKQQIMDMCHICIIRTPESVFTFPATVFVRSFLSRFFSAGYLPTRARLQ